MTDQEHEIAVELWNEIMSDVTQVIKDKLSSNPMNFAQRIFLHNMCAEQLYHAGWNALNESNARPAPPIK